MLWFLANTYHGPASPGYSGVGVAHLWVANVNVYGQVPVNVRRVQ